MGKQHLTMHLILLSHSCVTTKSLRVTQPVQCRVLNLYNKRSGFSLACVVCMYPASAMQPVQCLDAYLQLQRVLVHSILVVIQPLNTFTPTPSAHALISLLMWSDNLYCSMQLKTGGIWCNLLSCGGSMSPVCT